MNVTRPPFYNSECVLYVNSIKNSLGAYNIKIRYRNRTTERDFSKSELVAKCGYVRATQTQ